MEYRGISWNIGGYRGISYITPYDYTYIYIYIPLSLSAIQIGTYMCMYIYIYVCVRVSHLVGYPPFLSSNLLI